MAEVVKLELVEVGSEFQFDADELLESAKRQGLGRMAIIGETEDGTMWITGTANTGETIILMEMAKHALIFGDDA